MDNLNNGELNNISGGRTSVGMLTPEGKRTQFNSDYGNEITAAHIRSHYVKKGYKVLWIKKNKKKIEDEELIQKWLNTGVPNDDA